MEARDLLGDRDGDSIVYCRAPLPDFMGAFEAEHGEGSWADARTDDPFGEFAGEASPRPEDEDEDERKARLAWEALRDARQDAGPSRGTWMKVFNDAWDFIEMAERLEGVATRVLIHASRGQQRANWVAAAYLIRKFGLRISEALAHVCQQCPATEGASESLLVALAQASEAPGAVAKGDNPLRSSGLIPRGVVDALKYYEDAYSVGLCFCDECFDEYRFGEEDAALALRADSIVQRLKRSDPQLTAIELKGEPLSQQQQHQMSGQVPSSSSSWDGAAFVAAVSALADAIGQTFSPLWRVDLSGCGLGDVGCDALCRGLAYQGAANSSSRVSQQHTTGAGSAEHHQSAGGVTVLVLQYNHLGDAAAQSLARLLAGVDAGGAEHPLAFLDLGFNAIGVEGATALAGCLHTNESLATLALNSNALGDDGGEVLALALCEPSEEIYEQAAVHAAAATSRASANKAKKAGEKAATVFLRQHRRNRSLTHLNLCSNDLGQKATAQLAIMAKENPVLAALELSHNSGLGSTEVKQLASALREHKPPLEMLSIGQMVLGDDVAALFGKVLDPKEDAVAAWQAKKHEEEVLRQASGDMRPVVMTAPVWRPCVLRTLLLPHNRLLSTSAKRLSTALQVNTSLTALGLPQNPLGPKGAAHLAEALAVNHSLTWLDLEGCGFNEGAAQALSVGLAKNQGLRFLELSENHLGSHGVGHVASALKVNTTLLTLRLDSVRAGLIGADFLAKGLAMNSGLLHLSFSGNRIRNTGVGSFVGPLVSNTTLCAVDLSFNDFDADGGAKPLLVALEKTTEPGADRAHSTRGLHLNISGNDGCDDLISPFLARAKSRWDFWGAVKRPKLATNPSPFPLAKTFADPRIKDAYHVHGNNAALAQGGLYY